MAPAFVASGENGNSRDYSPSCRTWGISPGCACLQPRVPPMQAFFWLAWEFPDADTAGD